MMDKDDEGYQPLPTQEELRRRDAENYEATNYQEGIKHGIQMFQSVYQSISTSH